jgi:hypothetical protein
MSGCRSSGGKEGGVCQRGPRLVWAYDEDEVLELWAGMRERKDTNIKFLTACLNGASSSMLPNECPRAPRAMSSREAQETSLSMSTTSPWDSPIRLANMSRSCIG